MLPTKMIWMSRKYVLHFLVIIVFVDLTQSHDSDTTTEGHRHGRVNGRIVKLYSGPKAGPILCVGEGFLADAVDCSVFYRCLKASNGKYTVYRFQCGPGTVYDPDTEICNHPRSTKRSQCGGLNTVQLLSSTQGYIENEIDGLQKENDELPSPISTKPPKAIDSILNTIVTSQPDKVEGSYLTTIYPWYTTSKQTNSETIKTTTPSTWDIPASISTVKLWDYTPTQATYYFSRQPNVHSGVQCTSDGFMGDNEDCRKFYRCVNNQRGGYLKYEFSCSESTIWDDDTQGCNHPWAVQRRRCGKGNSYGENVINDFDQIKINEVAPNDILQHQTQFFYGSPTQTQNNKATSIQNQSQFIFGDRLNQEKINIIQNQTQINYGDAIRQSQTQFISGNEVKLTQFQIDRPNQSSPSQTYVTDNLLSTTTVTSSTTHAVKNNTNKCTEVGFMSGSTDCKKFYMCTSNPKGGFTAHEFSCSDGTLWDEDLQACNHARAVRKCGGKKISKNTFSPVGMFEHTTLKDYTTAASSSYSNDIYDIGYMKQINQNEIELLKSSTVTTLLSTLTTESLKLYETNCQRSGFFGNVYDCAKFYRCAEDSKGRFTKYEYRCGDGTVWDSEIESCNHAWSAKPCYSKNINNTQKEDLSVSTNSEDAIITTVSLIQTTTQRNIFDHEYDSGYGTLHSESQLHSTPTTGRSTTTTTLINDNNECKLPGFIGDNNDCKKFYRCTENGHGGYTRHEFTCGEGTVWDPDIEACNHAWAVKNCGGGTIKDNNINVVTLQPAVSEDISNKNDSYTSDNTDSAIKTTTSSSSTNSIMPVTNKANNCEIDGFMGDANNCKTFYRCVENGNGGFVRYEFLCGDGTVWDPTISACNHAWAVEKCGGSTLAHENVSPSSQKPILTTIGIEHEISTQHTISSSSSTIITSTSSNKNDECNGNNFIGDKQDCKKFYRCVEDGKGSYIRYEFTCGEGTLWDSEIAACNHAWAVKSCENNGYSNSASASSSLPTTLKDEETVYGNNTTQSNQEIIGSTENNFKPSTMNHDNGECNTDGFKADVKDCKKIYRCVDSGSGSFIRYEFTCGDGTVWDSDINACNHVNSVKSPCNSMSTLITKEIEPNYTVSSSSIEPNDYSTTSKVPPISRQCEQEGFFGDITDCKKFYRCTDNGQGGFHKYEFTCGEGTIWNQEILACDHTSSTSHCSTIHSGTQTESSVSHSTLTTTTGISQSTEKIYTSTHANVCTSEGFYGNANDCKKFFRCVGDGKGGYTKYDFTCGDGTIWVQDIQACDHDTFPSMCRPSTNTATTTTVPSSQETPLTTSSMLSDTTGTIQRSTSTPGTKPMQDEAVSGPTSTSETSSSSSSKNQDSCEQSGFYGNSKNCKMFYRCVENENGGFTKYDFTCGEGTIWDQDINACNHPQDVSTPTCENNESVSATTTRTTTTMETSEPSKTTSSIQSSTTENHESSTSKPNSNNYSCTEAGFFPDPSDCKKFYRCVDWGNDGKSFSIFHFDCGEGTIWDPELQTCNYEDSVNPPRNCSATQSQNENNNSTTTTTKKEETTESTETSTTTKKSTTQKSTTPSSTIESSTDKTSTQKPSSTEQTSSTQQSSTNPSTTQKTTTQQSTTAIQSTTEQSTTQQTTKQSTTEQSTTQKSTTASKTTPSTTEQSTTQQSTTEQSTTQQSTTTSDHTTTEQTTTTQKTTTSEQAVGTTTEQTTTTSNEETTTSAQTTASESTTSTTDQSTKAEQTTTQESSTEQSSENQSSTTEQTSSQETTDQSSTIESALETTTKQDSSDKECPQTDDDQYLYVCPTGFRRHPKYCNLFYQCTEDDDSHEMKVAVFHCPNNTIYDESKTQCVEEEKADTKCSGQIAQRRRVKRLDANYKEPIIVRKEQNLCPAAGHFPFENSDECSPVLFKCEVSKSGGKLSGFLYQCPERYVYWSISRRCEPINTMTNCKRSVTSWKGRYEIPIEKNNVAKKL